MVHGKCKFRALYVIRLPLPTGHAQSFQLGPFSIKESAFEKQIKREYHLDLGLTNVSNIRPLHVDFNNICQETLVPQTAFIDRLNCSPNPSVI